MEPHDHIRYLGQPLQNTSAMIVDTGSLDVLPYGAIGELCFGGDQVALGYLNQQELTEAKFVMHPEHGRIYRSGDLGRMLPDGSIIILGRVDDQVKLHGLRIEPGEISAVLQQHSSVEAAATVLATGGSDNEPVMVSFYVPLDQRQTATSSSLALGVDEYQRSLMAELLDHLRSRLPDYMVPAWLIPVSRIPTTSSGKIDKDYLRHTFSELGAEFLRNLGVTSTEEASERECWSSTERTIIETLAKTLSIDGTSIRRWISFASLGLDSISAITFAQRLSTRIEKRITVSNILQNPTIGLLSVAIENQMLHASSTAAANLDVFPKDFISRIHKETESRGLGVKVVLPCTPLQEAMVVSGVKHLAYVNRMLFRLNGDISQMQRAWEAMVRRHDIFRTFFIATPVAQFPICQVVTENWELRWESFDTLDRTLLECVAAQSSQLPRALDSFQSPYSLAIIVDGSTYFLSFVCHHALYDGVAMSTLMHEIEKTVIGQPLEAVSSYESFLQEALTVPPSSEEFWYTMLRGFAPVKIPRQSSEISRSGGEDFVTSIPREISLSSVDSFARRSGVSRSAVFETVWAIALCILTRRSDICFGKVMSGRSAPVRGIKSLVAPTFNTVPIRADLADFKLCADALRNTDSLGISLYTHQFAPLKRLKRMSAEPEKSLFDTVLLIQEPAKSIDPQVWTLVLDEGSMDVSNCRHPFLSNRELRCGY